MYIDKLHDIFHLLFLFLQFFHLQHININYSNLFQSFPNMLAMLIMVLLKSEQNQVHVFQYICLKSFQIQQPIIMYHFESTSHNNHLNFIVQSLSKPSKHFNVVSTLSFGWRDVATWDNVKSTLKQRCVFQRWNLQCLTTSNQRCVFQRWHEQR